MKKRKIKVIDDTGKNLKPTKEYERLYLSKFYSPQLGYLEIEKVKIVKVRKSKYCSSGRLVEYLVYLKPVKRGADLSWFEENKRGVGR